MSLSSDDGSIMEKQKLSDLSQMKPVKNMDDFIKLGWYCTRVLSAAEFITLTSLSSMVYMVYAGISPTVIGCGAVSFNSSDYACENLLALRLQTNCTPILEYQFYSVNIEFDLLCDDSKLVKNSISIQMVGVLIGALIAGQLSDLYGRKTILICSLLGFSAFSFGTLMTMSFVQFTMLRAIVGFFTGGLSAVQGVFLIENVPVRHRMWINTVITWSPNFIIFPMIAYLSGDWRTLAGFSAVISLVAAVNLCFLYESPRWMIHKGQINRARIVLAKIRRINRDVCEVEASELENMLLHEQSVHDTKLKKRRKYTFYHIVCTWKYLSWTITICSGILTTSLVNYGLLFNMEKLSGSLYWNNTFFGVIRWIVNIVVGVADYLFKWIGRKTINFASIIFIISSLALICGLYWQDLQKQEAWVIRCCTIGVSAMTSQLYLAKFMITNELFPTAVRNLAVAALSVSSRIGTIMAPQLFYLSHISDFLPYLVLLILSCIDWVSFQVVLPETKGKHLENHLPPKEQRIFFRKQSIIEA